MSAQFDALVQKAKDAVATQNALKLPRISVGISGCSESVGARTTLAAIRAELAARRIDAIVEEVGCRGMCYAEPMVDIETSGGPRIAYGPIDASDVSALIDAVVVRKDPRPDLALFVVGETGYAGIPAEREHPFFRLQTRHLLENCGRCDPLSLDQYLAAGGFTALVKALTTMSPEDVIN
jgi:hypothetical protein